MEILKYEILVKFGIFVYDNKKEEFTQRELAHSINISRFHPCLREMLKILLEKQIIKLTNRIGNVKFFTANKIKLRDFVDELPFILKINEEYNSRYHIRPY